MAVGTLLAKTINNWSEKKESVSWTLLYPKEEIKHASHLGIIFFLPNSVNFLFSEKWSNLYKLKQHKKRKPKPNILQLFMFFIQIL